MSGLFTILGHLALAIVLFVVGFIYFNADTLFLFAGMWVTFRGLEKYLLEPNFAQTKDPA
jgi:hypothetical protein